MNTAQQFIVTVMALCLAVVSAAAPVSVAYTYDTLNRLTAAAYTDSRPAQTDHSEKRQMASHWRCLLMGRTAMT